MPAQRAMERVQGGRRLVDPFDRMSADERTTVERPRFNPMSIAPPTYRPAHVALRREQRRQADDRRRQAKPWRRWYNSKLWRQRRAEQLTAEPYCRRHARRGETVVATVANHIKPHRGNWTLFAEGELECLCKPCHDGEAQREDIASDRAVGPMGGGVVG